MFFDEARARKLNDKEVSNEGQVIYWMSRDQRVHGNWALNKSINLSKELSRELTVIFCKTSNFLNAQSSQFDFMEKGLLEVKENFKELGINFEILIGNPDQEVIKYQEANKASVIVTDFSPLKIGREWRKKVAKEVTCQVLEVDAHNIIPAFYVSDKLEYGAYTLRPKIRKLLERFFTKIPEFPIKNNSEANSVLKNFLNEKLAQYADNRNLPEMSAQSNLSAYIHFGNISSQEIALVANKLVKNKPELKESFDAFFEQLVVRKELADNFCLYNQNYDSFEGFNTWAKISLLKHQSDHREPIYSLEEFENAKTHDDLWNAGQCEMAKTGKMHGYMRMYWAKKILEWTKDPREAMSVAVYLNDKYELDGRDPNGYAGIAWAIGGTHDRPWFERPIYGQIRYMNRGGCDKKFDTKSYINKFLN